MKVAHLFFQLALASTAPANEVLRRQDVAPEMPEEEYDGPSGDWTFTLQTWSGDGCPDFGETNATRPNYMQTRQSTGPFMPNTSVDTFWSYFAFPYMEAALPLNGPTRMTHVSCDLIVQYEQTTESGGSLRDEEKTHILRLHKNGSLVEANYDLDEGVNAEWQVRYLDTEDFTVMVRLPYQSRSCLNHFQSLPGYGYKLANFTQQAQDWSSVDGPIKKGDNYTMALEWLPPLFTLEPFVVNGCGKSLFRIRFELWLAARSLGMGGIVGSKKVDYNNGSPPKVSGTNLGFSYDWVKCEK